MMTEIMSSIISVFFSLTPLDNPLNLDSKQLQTAYYIYNKTKSVTLVSIAYQESQLNKYPVNTTDPSCGAFHTHLHFRLKSINKPITPFNKNVECSKLLDLDYAIDVTLKFIDKIPHRNYKDIIRYYNAGRNLSYANDYYAKITKYNKIFKRMFNDSSREGEDIILSKSN